MPFATAAATGAAIGAIGAAGLYYNSQNGPQKARRPSLGQVQFYSVLPESQKPDPYANPDIPIVETVSND
ncbi:hypothetical protein K493DRAFT_358540 [Basidiobolus meristosporus CBS 931.73]|uniref:Uncharacterized protein n=1 Tax=Basidiobolus meristosporus CBS 931.73 TaxID=1314790 RepID=A0A1Y1XU14_9FUNG|nr:hypothetical protein K493DRAFT_358540 [Basidiobolus meristosporus CBS 931.73]|eukprot:ORX89175.1 hypothetical protein K493DRAFT_358540 [Basidiobolus meristosporus CBS 931.73]